MKPLIYTAAKKKILDKCPMWHIAIFNTQYCCDGNFKPSLTLWYISVKASTLGMIHLPIFSKGFILVSVTVESELILETVDE